MKKILMLIYRFPSTRAIRPLKFAKYLPGFGWQPYIVSPRNLMPQEDAVGEQGLDEAVVLRTFNVELNIIFRLFKAKNTPESSGKSKVNRSWFARLRQLLLFPDAYLIWFPFAFFTSFIAIRRYNIDVIYSTMPHTCNFIAYYLKKTTGRPWIIDYRDLWTQNPYVDYNGPLRKRLDLFWEKRFLATADMVIVVSNDMKDKLSKLMDQKGTDKLHVITNGYDPDDFDGSNHVTTLKWDGPFNMVYTGSLLGRKRDIVPLLQAIRNLLNTRTVSEDDLRITIVGPDDTASRRAAENLGLSGMIEWKGVVPHAAALGYQRMADALLFIENHPKSAPIYTGKLFEYLASKRPIFGVAHKDGVASRLISESDSGVVADFNDIREVESKLLDLIRRKNSFAFKEESFRRFDRRILTQDLARLLDKNTFKKETASINA